MATIPTNALLANEVAVSKLDLASGPHTFTFDPVEQTLQVDNGEAGNLTLNILGAGVTVFDCKGLEQQNVSAGYDFIIPTLEQRSIVTSDYNAYTGSLGNLVTVTVTGDTGLSFAWLTKR